ncbi:hypothetical protein EW146_g6335 [Bondarzewia mesenterica]|uniref:Uncharacterized protein n=1 Tax=Bondarzewia mesenterica TaxID=1095465 RepID=A0A4S4LPU8_9AGAM|nr:hypothetical protein EW146_g6335 [Bondarzewia mesenterica]
MVGLPRARQNLTDNLGRSHTHSTTGPCSSPMPSENISHPPSSQQLDLLQPQVKLCSRCHSPLSADIDSTLPQAYLHGSADANDHLMICRLCRDRLLPRASIQSAQERLMYVALGQSFVRRVPTHAINEADSMTRPVIDRSLDDDQDMESPTSAVFERSFPSTSAASQLISAASQLTSAPKPARLSLDCSSSSSNAPIAFHAPSPLVQSRFAPSVNKNTARPEYLCSPDPFVDISRIRMRSQGHHCLYPGATFQGTQKSGRNSYDVTVTIVDVDFSSSFLCGYLCIRGLTDDWPELTTYFDAEIIGTRYGFLTQNWGANEQEDMVHWARFPAFRHIKNKLKTPHLTTDSDCGAVFMRWKERFLVPDHRVQDINGASFAGFYYVCVDFNSHASAPSIMRPSPLQRSSVLEDVDAEAALPAPPLKPEPAPRRARESSTREESSVSRRSSSVGARSGPAVATMSGFYFHQNSEPYQQLSLKHVPESVSSSYELR